MTAQEIEQAKHSEILRRLTAIEDTLHVLREGVVALRRRKECVIDNMILDNLTLEDLIGVCRIPPCDAGARSRFLTTCHTTATRAE